MSNKWITHVKKVQKEKGISYADAMKVASKSYKPVSGEGKKRKRKQHGRGIVDKSKKFYNTHKSKIHAAGAIAAGALAAGLTAKQLHNRRKHGTLERFMQGSVDPNWVMPY